MPEKSLADAQESMQTTCFRSELHDEALFKDPPAKGDCPICFLPMPAKLIACTTLPPATISSVPIFDFAEANKEIDGKATETYYPCCGKFICKGCVQSFCKSGNQVNCSFCKSERWNQITGYHTDEERIEELMNRIEKNDASALCEMSRIYYSGLRGVQQDRVKAMELLKKAAELGSSESHFS